MPSTLNAVKQRHQRLPHAADRGVDQVRVHQHHASSRAYRGAGRPEGNYYMERLIDYAAAETRHRPRRAAPAQPDPATRDAATRPPPGMTYDSGDFPAVLKQALEVADWKGFSQRKRESRKRGKLRGLGIGCYLEVTAPPTRRWAASASRPTAA